MGILVSVVTTLFIAQIYIENAIQKNLYDSFAKQREELAQNIAKAIVGPLSTFAPSDASSALEILKQDSTIAKIYVYDALLETAFIEIDIPSRYQGNSYKNRQKISNDKKEELGWVEITFNGVHIQNQLDAINEVINIVLSISLVVLGVVMAVLLYIKVFSPLKILFNQAEDFQNNHLEKSYIWENSDELGVVGKSFEEARVSILTLFQELSRKNKDLEKLYIVDKLTNVYNRHKLDMELNTQENNFKRYNQPFGIVLVDIDDFKCVNDTYGHLVGDRVLVAIAYLLQKHIRKTDILGRWGGEEFLIIVPQATQQDLFEVARKLKDCIQNHDFDLQKQITASFGLTLYEKDLTTLLKNADDALYKIKKSGKNNVAFV